MLKIIKSMECWMGYWYRYMNTLRWVRGVSGRSFDMGGCSHMRSMVACLPVGKHTKKLWKITIFNGKIHYKWPFSIAMLVHQRVPVGKLKNKYGKSPCLMNKWTISMAMVEYLPTQKPHKAMDFHGCSICYPLVIQKTMEHHHVLAG